MPPEPGNPAKRLEWAPAARKSFEASIAHISADDPFVAERVKERVGRALGQLARFPQLGTPASRKGELRFPIPRTGHVVNYRIARQAIRIVLWYRARQNIRS